MIKFTFLYLLFAFIMQDFNLINWGIIARTIMAILWFSWVLLHFVDISNKQTLTPNPDFRDREYLKIFLI